MYLNNNTITDIIDSTIYNLIETIPSNKHSKLYTSTLTSDNIWAVENKKKHEFLQKKRKENVDNTDLFSYDRAKKLFFVNIHSENWKTHKIILQNKSDGLSSLKKMLNNKMRCINCYIEYYAYNNIGNLDCYYHPRNCKCKVKKTIGCKKSDHLSDENYKWENTNRDILKFPLFYFDELFFNKDPIIRCLSFDNEEPWRSYILIPRTEKSDKKLKIFI